MGLKTALHLYLKPTEIHEDDYFQNIPHCKTHPCNENRVFPVKFLIFQSRFFKNVWVVIICITLHQTFYVAHCAGFLEGCKFFSQEGGLGPTRITIFPEKSLDFKSIGCTLKRSRLMILNQVFSNFSCMFLNPNNFFQFEF